MGNHIVFFTFIQRGKSILIHISNLQQPGRSTTICWRTSKHTVIIAHIQFIKT